MTSTRTPRTRRTASLVLAGTLAMGGLTACGDDDEGIVDDDVEQDVSDGADQLSEDVSDGADQLSEDVSEGADQLSEDVSEGAEDLSDEVEEQVDEGAEENSDDGGG